MFKTLLVLFLICQLASCELKFVIEVFRHGARHSLNIPSLEAGELTPVGQRQHYLLGSQLREEYINQRKFLSENFDQSELSVFSSDYNRTIQSAQSQLFGFYPLKTGQNISDTMQNLAVPEFNHISQDPSLLGTQALPQGFQPIPLRVDKRMMIDIIEDDVSQTVEQRNSQFYKRLVQEQQNTYKVFKEKSGSPIQKDADELKELYAYIDDLYCNIYQGHETPKWFKNDPDLARNMTMVNDIYFFMRVFQTKPQQAQFSKPFFDFMEEILPKTKLEGGDLKWQMLSGHDTTIAMLNSYLNITSAECIYEQYKHVESQELQCKKPPRFTANLLFEFYKDEYKGKYIKIRYNGEYVFLCEKQDNECGYEEFLQRVKFFQKKKRNFNNDRQNFLQIK